MKHVTIHIGELFASRDPAIVETVLGSCVAVCLYDPAARIGGMNHILLPHGPPADPLPARYGEHALPMLISRLTRLGARESHLQAKIFGAASVLNLDEKALSVPKANRNFVRDFLDRHDIPVVSERLGGREPLAVRLYTETGKALVRALPRTRLDRVLATEGEQFRAALARRWAWFEEGAAILEDKI